MGCEAVRLCGGGRKILLIIMRVQQQVRGSSATRGANLLHVHGCIEFEQNVGDELHQLSFLIL